MIELPQLTASKAGRANYAKAALRSIFRFDYANRKVFVLLKELMLADFRQTDLFAKDSDEKQLKLSRVVESLIIAMIEIKSI